ncbi:hypothetical protein ACQP2T_44280 [Nonomuraea sp. CA-143628]|uniref:hypothetical protein n=1 Tax=Nonomuraea sp. CA-143628 TaxID=3239997 RepID=UPI003D929169
MTRPGSGWLPSPAASGMPMPMSVSLTVATRVRSGSVAMAKGRWTSPSGISVGGVVLASSTISGTTWVSAARAGSVSAKAGVPAEFTELRARIADMTATTARVGMRTNVLPLSVGATHKRRKRKDHYWPVR